MIRVANNLEFFVLERSDLFLLLRVEWRVEGLKEYRKRCNTRDTERKRM